MRHVFHCIIANLLVGMTFSLATYVIVDGQSFLSGHAAAMAEVDAIVQPVGWGTIRKTKEACEAKWKTECVITGGYMPKMDAQNAK